jgi:hypothetical protein
MEKRTVRGVAVLGVVCLLGLGGPRGLAPGVAAQSQKQEPNNGWAYVNCDKGPSGALQRAIDRATSGQTIHVSGTCYENVTIPAGKDLLTLDGGGEATIDGPDDTANTILVRGPRGVTITRLTITGGRVGIDVSRGSSALIDSNHRGHWTQRDHTRCVFHRQYCEQNDPEQPR